MNAQQYVLRCVRIENLARGKKMAGNCDCTVMEGRGDTRASNKYKT